MNAHTILIADDETHVLHVLSTRIESAGFTVVTAADGAEACRLAGLLLPSLLVVDFQMPSLGGLELSARLMRDPLAREIPVILMTPHGVDVSPADRPANVRHVLAKPFAPTELLDMIEAELAETCVLAASPL